MSRRSKNEQDSALCPECKRTCFGTGVDAVCCSECERFYHGDCRGPSQPGDVEAKLWVCRRCSCSPLTASLDKIITWRWRQPEMEEDEEEEPLSVIKEKLLKKRRRTAAQMKKAGEAKPVDPQPMETETIQAAKEGSAPSAGIIATRNGGLKRKRDSEEKPQPAVTLEEVPPEPATEAGKLCRDFGLQDVGLEYSRNDYDVVDSYEVFQQAFKHELAAANPKIGPEELTMLVRAKWEDFTSGAPSAKSARTESEDKEATQTSEEKKDVVEPSVEAKDSYPDPKAAVVVIKRLSEQVVRKYTRVHCEEEQEPREREFLVKWKDHSYWHCAWVTETQLDVHEPRKLLSYKTRTDMDQPPPCYTREDLEDEGWLSKQDPLGLFDRFYKWGIRPQWLQVQKVINHKEMTHGSVYYIKWKGLAYKECTWEDKYTGIPDLDTHICDYEDLSHICGFGPKRRRRSHDKNHNPPKEAKAKARFSPPPKKPTRNLDKPYTDQPKHLLPKGFKLHKYQLEGVSWARNSWNHDTNIILADEMGLGKTIQTIIFLQSLYREGHCQGPFLISVPLSTLTNWEREFELWAPELNVISYIGDQESRDIIRQNELSFEKNPTKTGNKACRLNAKTVKFHVLLTSYELITTDMPCLASIDWQVLVVDEAHRLKNGASKFFTFLRKYSVHYTLLLTGTPLQNNLKELYYLLNFLVPSKFDDMETFLANFLDIAKEEQIHKLHEMLGPHMLRRLKADVIEGMPAKSELIVRTNLAPIQKTLYKNILMKNYDVLKTQNGSLTNYKMMFIQLRKVANHPYLFDAYKEQAPITSRGLYEAKPMVEACGKLELLSKMLKKLKAGGHRVLIFSQWTKMLDILEDFLDAEKYLYERIDGDTKSQDRQEAIDRFNSSGSPQFVFLLSTRAGGLGINMYTADTVFLYDSDWNPHNDIQALSRAHRIGQKNKVMIYRFVTKNTVEERMVEVAKKKMMLTHLVVTPGKNGETKLTKAEIDDILRFGTKDLFAAKGAQTEPDIVYDDDAVEALLDRSQKDTVDKESIANEYLSSFKVAQYTESECPETADVKCESGHHVEMNNDSNAVADTDGNNFWDNVLQSHHQEKLKEEEDSLGRGKRRSAAKKVNYLVDVKSPKKGKKAKSEAQEEPEDDDKEFSVHEEEESSDEDVSDDEVDMPNKVPTKSTKKAPKSLPSVTEMASVFESVATRVDAASPIRKCTQSAKTKKEKELEILRYIDNHVGYACLHADWFWETMARSPIAGQRNATSLRRDFYLNILPNLKHYDDDLTEAQYRSFEIFRNRFDEGVQEAENRIKSTQPPSFEERVDGSKILLYIVNHGGCSEVFKTSFWSAMAQSPIAQERDGNALKHHFYDIVLPKLKYYKFYLHEPQYKSFEILKTEYDQSKARVDGDNVSKDPSVPHSFQAGVQESVNTSAGPFLSKPVRVSRQRSVSESANTNAGPAPSPAVGNARAPRSVSESRGDEYSLAEDLTILRFIDRHDLYPVLRQSMPWRTMEARDVCPGRSATSLKSRFLNLWKFELHKFERYLTQTQYRLFEVGNRKEKVESRLRYYRTVQKGDEYREKIREKEQYLVKLEDYSNALRRTARAAAKGSNPKSVNTSNPGLASSATPTSHAATPRTDPESNGQRSVEGGEKRKKSPSYTPAEDLAILRYIVEKDLYTRIKDQGVGARSIWREMEVRNVCPGRTAVSMRAHFINYVFGNQYTPMKTGFIRRHLTEAQFNRIKLEKEIGDLVDARHSTYYTDRAVFNANKDAYDLQINALKAKRSAVMGHTTAKKSVPENANNKADPAPTTTPVTAEQAATPKSAPDSTNPSGNKASSPPLTASGALGDGMADPVTNPTPAEKAATQKRAPDSTNASGNKANAPPLAASGALGDQAAENSSVTSAQQKDYVTLEVPYTGEEDYQILEFISKHEMYARVMMGPSLWQYMEKKTLVCPGRSAMSMRQRFHEIVKDEKGLGLYRFPDLLSQDQIGRFLKWIKAEEA